MHGIFSGRGVEGCEPETLLKLPGLERDDRVTDADLILSLLHFGREYAHVVKREFRRDERIGGASAFEFQIEGQRFAHLREVAVESAGKFPLAHKSEVDASGRRGRKRFHFERFRSGDRQRVRFIVEVVEHETESERSAFLLSGHDDVQRQRRPRLDPSGFERTQFRVELEFQAAAAVVNRRPHRRLLEVGRASVGPGVAARDQVVDSREFRQLDETRPQRLKRINRDPHRNRLADVIASAAARNRKFSCDRILE